MPLDTNDPSLVDAMVVPVAVQADPAITADPTGPGAYRPLRVDPSGALEVAIVGPGLLPVALPDNVDNVAEVATLTRIPTVARLYGLDGPNGGTDFDRLRCHGDVTPVDPADFASGVLSTGSRLYLFQNAGANLQRVPTGDDGTEGLAVLGDVIMPTDTRKRLWSAFESQWLREHGNEVVTVLASAARTVTTASATFDNISARGGHFVIDVSAVTGSPTITAEIQGFDPVSSTFYALLTGINISAIGVTVLKIYPGASPVANLTANDVLPYQYRVNVTHANADSITYSVGANLVK